MHKSIHLTKNNFIWILIFLFQLSSCQGQDSLYYKILKPIQKSQASTPVLFLLHGFGSNETDLLGLAPALPKNLLIISVRAPFEREGGGYMWYNLQFGDGTFKEDLEQAQQSSKMLNELISKITNEYKIDTNNIFVGGFSQGAITSLRLGLNPPYRLKGIVCLSGRFPDEINCNQNTGNLKKRTHLFISHGIEDRVLPISEGRFIVKKLNECGFDISTKEYNMQHQISNEVLTDLNAWLVKELNRKPND